MQNSVSVVLNKMKHQRSLSVKTMHASRTFSKFQRRTNIALSEKTLQSFMVKSDIIVPRCLDELFPFRRKNAFDVLSSILGTVFNRGSMIRCAALAFPLL